METVNIHEAKTNLSKLIARVEAGEEICITRNGEPAATLGPPPQIKKIPKRRVAGALKGKMWLAPDWDSPETNEEIARLFYDSLGIDYDTIPLTGKADEIPR